MEEGKQRLLWQQASDRLPSRSLSARQLLTIGGRRQHGVEEGGGRAQIDIRRG
jgi:hypothetical protein